MRKNFSSYVLAFVLAISIGGLVYTGADYCYFSEANTDIIKQREEILSLKAQNDESQRIANNIAELETNFSNVENTYNRLRPLIPEESELPKVMDAIEDSARNRKLKLDLFSKSQPKQMDRGLTEVPITVEVSGYYAAVGGFVEELARFDRILYVSAVRMVNLSAEPIYNQAEATVRATITVSAYVGKENQSPKAKG